MITSIPIWAKIYWLILLIFYSAGNYSEYKDGERNIGVILIDTISFLFISLFIIEYFDKNGVFKLGLWLIPMVVAGVSWEMYITHNEICKHENNPDPELSEIENKICNNIGLTISNLIVVPGYFVGIWLSAIEIKKLV